MYTKIGNNFPKTNPAKRSLSIFLSIILGFSLLFTASAAYSEEVLPPPTSTLAKYQAITIGMTKEDVIALLGGEGTWEADRMIYQGVTNDSDTVKQVEVSIDSVSGLVYQKKIQYAFRVLVKGDKEYDNYNRKWDVYIYTGKATKLTVPAYVSETVYLDAGNMEKTKKDYPIIYLELSKKKLSALNVSKCTKLQYLGCDRNKLTKLDVTNNKSLWLFDCTNNRLCKLNVTKNAKLQILWCDRNKLKKLNVTKNKKLLRLGCSKNSLKKVNVSKNRRLEALYCNNNKIKKLNVTKNKMLLEFHCNNNKIKKINVSKNKDLIWLLCSRNSLKKLNLQKNKYLIVLECYNNKIKALDVSKNKYLQYLEVDKKLPKSKLPKWLRNVKPTKDKGHWVYIRRMVY